MDNSRQINAHHATIGIGDSYNLVSGGFNGFQSRTVGLFIVHLFRGLFIFSHSASTIAELAVIQTTAFK